VEAIVVVCFKILSRDAPAVNDKNHTEPQSSRHRYDHSNSLPSVFQVGNPP